MKNELYRNPTLKKVMRVEAEEKGPLICKKNLQRGGRYPDRCLCSSGYHFPRCLDFYKGGVLVGFEAIDDE